VWEPGDSVLVRSIFRGRVRWTFPHTLVENSPDSVAFFIRPGVEGRWVPRTGDGHDIRAWGSDVGPSPHVWTSNRVLWTTRFGSAHSLGLFWDDETDRFLGWYVNLQAPLRRSPLGFDTLDHALDVWIEPDGTWSWKDEADLALCVELGLFSPGEAAEIRTEGECVIDALPELLPTGWEDWRPDPAWPAPTLPAGWNEP
jgi:hypothetical protein